MRYHRHHKNPPARVWTTIVQLVALLTIAAAFAAFNYKYTQSRTARTAALRGAVAVAATATAGSLPQRRDAWVSEASQPFNQNGAATSAQHLIVVAGHSVTVTGHLEDADVDEVDWYLLDYQRGRGLPAAIVGHIRAGLAAARRDPQALVVFSGGETRAATGPETEASSYYRVADAMNLWAGTEAVGEQQQQPSSVDATATLRARTVTEEFATDSYENLLFSICRFYEVTQSYPTKITMVSFTFKRRRFVELHAPALRWPSDQFAYIGVDPPPSTGFDLEQATRGEAENAARPFESDPYGCHSAVLLEKRRARNPFYRTPPYTVSCPDLRELLRHCGPETIARALVPWGRSEQ